jgi:hypothetical protein
MAVVVEEDVKYNAVFVPDGAPKLGVAVYIPSGTLNRSPSFV